MTCAAYAPTLRAGLVYEDRRDTGTTLDAWQMLTKVHPTRALSQVSRAVDLAVFGIQPWGAHLTNLLLHGVNVTLLLALAWGVLPMWGAVAAALLFALHPVQVEAVAYVSSRPDLLATCGVLLALLAASRGSVAGAVCGVTVASLSKESAIVAWGLVPLWAAWCSAPFSLTRWFALSTIGAAGGAVLAVMFIRGWAPTFDLGLMGAQLATLFRLLLLVPVPVGFTVDHDWTQVSAFAWPALILALGLTVWAVTEGWLYRSWLAFGWLWTLVVVAPRLFVPLYEGLHEHHLYSAMVGWCLCAGHWLKYLAAREERTLWV